MKTFDFASGASLFVWLLFTLLVGALGCESFSVVTDEFCRSRCDCDSDDDLPVVVPPLEPIPQVWLPPTQTIVVPSGDWKPTSSE